MSNSENQIIDIPQRQLMAEARHALEGKWGMAAATFFVYTLVTTVASVVPLVTVIVGGPFALGVAIFALRLGRGEEVELNNIFDGFQDFGRSLAAYLLMIFFVVAGLVFFIVPGIVIGLGLSQTFFILADDKNIGPVDALKHSWELMKGHKFDYFILGLRFLPLALLCLLTLGIGLFWLAPYMQTTLANFYDALRIAKGGSAGDMGDPFVDDISQHLVD